MTDQQTSEPKVKPELTKEEVTKLINLLNNLAQTTLVTPLVYSQEIVPLLDKLKQLNA
jgi:hypothetical protein